MKSLAILVSEEISKNSFLAEVLSSGLGNISAVAEEIKPSIEERLGKSVPSLTLGMAIRRQIKSLTPIQSRKYRWPKPDEVSCRNNIYGVAIARSDKSSELADKIRKALVIYPGDFLVIAAGSYEIAFSTSQRNKSALQKLIGKHKKTSEVENISAVTVNWPPLTKDIPGIYYAITRSLALKKITIQAFHTIGSEMMVLVDEKSLALAYETLLGLFAEQSSKRREKR
jgi:aspartokinase